MAKELYATEWQKKYAIRNRHLPMNSSGSKLALSTERLWEYKNCFCLSLMKDYTKVFTRFLATKKCTIQSLDFPVKWSF